MTKQDIELKIATTKRNTVLNETQKASLLAMYEKMLAKFDSEPEKKETPAKEEKVEKKPKHSIKERAKKVPAEVKERIDKKAKEIKESEPKPESKKVNYNCDDLIKEAKEKHAKAKAAAKERAEAPKKTEVTKSKEKIDRAHEAIEKQVESGKLAKAALLKLRKETKELLDFIDEAIKKA